MLVETRTQTADEVSNLRQTSLLTRDPDGDFRKYLTPEALAKAAAAEEREAKEKSEQQKPQLGKVIKLPAKRPDDPILRLEQNLGCELPVCVSNRRQVNDIAIEIKAEGGAIWKLERTASSLLPAPEHYLLWLWFLDRCQAAAKAGCRRPPRIAIDPQELHELFGGNLGGRWYENIHEAFRRFSCLVIQVHQAYHAPTKTPGFDGVFGTLCYFASRRMKNVPSEELEGFEWGWIAPGQMLWESVLSGYIKAVPMQTMQDVPTYIGQRLTTYLMKHCKPGEIFKVSLAKLLPKIPMECSVREARRKLTAHHALLVNVGFLTQVPVLEGRGENTMVTYERTPLGSS